MPKYQNLKMPAVNTAVTSVPPENDKPKEFPNVMSTIKSRDLQNSIYFKLGLFPEYEYHFPAWVKLFPT